MNLTPIFATNIVNIMEAKFKSLSIFEFQSKFPDEDSCYAYLSELKWKGGYECPKCKHKKHCKGINKYDRQCTKCGYLESPTAGSLFHKVKFSILKAFWIVYYVSTSKKGIASTELSRKLDLRQKTCWMFKQKVMQAMASSGDNLLTGKVEVDEFVIGQQEEGVVGRKNKNKRLIVIAIEKGGKGAGRIYAKQIDRSTKNNLKTFMDKTISKSAEIKTDAWSSYRSLEKEMPNLKTEKSKKKGSNFTVMHRIIMGFKSWLRGIHGHAKHLQYYLDEYCYRYNRNKMKEGIFDNLLLRMIKHKPVPYKTLIA
ncbi:MAG: IS1595 family transposase [Saprospiraceae bacterium]